MPLVDVAGVPDLAELPPHALDEGVVERPVGVAGVEPHPDAFGERLEVGHVAAHGLSTEPVELGDAVGLDLVLAGEPELLLDLDLHGQAVAVPAALAGDVATPHGLEPRVDVLEEAGPHVMDARPAVGGRRALVEHPLGCTLAPPEALREHVVGVPPGEHGLLEVHEVEGRGDGIEGHPGSLRVPRVGASSEIGPREARLREQAVSWVRCPGPTCHYNPALAPQGKSWPRPHQRRSRRSPRPRRQPAVAARSRLRRRRRPRPRSLLRRSRPRRRRRRRRARRRSRPRRRRRPRRGGEEVPGEEGAGQEGAGQEGAGEEGSREAGSGERSRLPRRRRRPRRRPASPPP